MRRKQRFDRIEAFMALTERYPRTTTAIMAFTVITIVAVMEIYLITAMLP